MNRGHSRLSCSRVGVFAVLCFSSAINAAAVEWFHEITLASKDDKQRLTARSCHRCRILLQPWSSTRIVWLVCPAWMVWTPYHCFEKSVFRISVQEAHVQVNYWLGLRKWLILSGNQLIRLASRSSEKVCKLPYLQKKCSNGAQTKMRKSKSIRGGEGEGERKRKRKSRFSKKRNQSSGN